MKLFIALDLVAFIIISPNNFKFFYIRLKDRVSFLSFVFEQKTESYNLTINL